MIITAEESDIDALLALLHHPALRVIEPGLERMQAFLAALGNPHKNIPPVVHIAGTNGKGSLVAYLHAIFKAAGLRVHRYTSPHLVRFNERILVADREISDDALLALLTRIQALAHDIPVTFFEATTAAAFLAFAARPADVTLLETGMGGRLDATNVIDAPMLTAITPVGMDHTEYLGDTLAAIAFEKAGIIKPGVPCVVGPQAPEALEVIVRVAQERSAPAFIFGRIWQVEHTPHGYFYRSAKHTLPLAPSLAGAHQIYNAATAMACAETLPVPLGDDAMTGGVASAYWPARLQCLRRGECEVWLDGGHNPAAGEILAQWAAREHAPLTLICGMIAGKDTHGFLAPLAPHAAQLLAIGIPGEPLSQTADAIARAAASLRIPVRLADSLQEALRMARTPGIPQRILICGSLYLAGRVLKTWSEQ
jgi:dihydrofolate synthase/folylpolyglutamate synthase